MSVPVEVLFRFGSTMPENINPDEILTTELKDRIDKLLTGKFNIDEAGRCVIDPIEVPFEGEARADSICVGVVIGPISIGYCKEIKQQQQQQ